LDQPIISEELSDAIIEVVDGGARIINLSLGLSTSVLVTYPKLQGAYDYALKHGVIIVAASGNQGNIGSISLLDNKWIIPVAACNEYGLLDPMSNFGASIGIRGLMSPGIKIISAASGSNSVEISRDIIRYTVQLDRNEYENIDKSKWMSDIAGENNLPTDGSVYVLIE
jgi:subtilisin family serine protease